MIRDVSNVTWESCTETALVTVHFMIPRDIIHVSDLIRATVIDDPKTPGLSPVVKISNLDGQW